MILGIDASNLRYGGGVTHLVEFLRAAVPVEHAFSSIIVWGDASTLNHLDDRPWMRKIHVPFLDRGTPWRVLWQYFRLCAQARREGCNLLLVPGSSYSGAFRPFVTMSQSMLPFAPAEVRRYGCSWKRLRLLLLRRSQARTFRKAGGVIFLSQYAKGAITSAVRGIDGASRIIPHGIGPQFLTCPRPQREIATYSRETPFRILYVSKIDHYKHHDHVISAVRQLRETGLPVHLDLVGAPQAAFGRLRQILSQAGRGEFVTCHGSVPYVDLPSWYRRADLFVFASSCENMPITLLEAMASGLPIACSDRGPMPEVLCNAGVYFNPEVPAAIADAIRSLIEDTTLRARCAVAAHEYAKSYSWERCAADTLAFLANVASGRPK